LRETFDVPPIIANAGPLLGRYRVLFCDVWGVVHDGRRAYAAAGDALARFRAGGGIVILVSNAPYPEARVAHVLDGKGVRRDTWDAIVSSGDIARQHVADEGYRRVHCIGPEPRDSSLFDSLPAERAPLSEAEAIVCSGLLRDRTETADDYRPLLETALARRLPFVCANPDLMVDVGPDRLPCAGAIAAVYESMGGPVFWAGKPHPIAYDTALARAAGLCGRLVEKNEILAIGDALRTDVAAAEASGIDALFIAGGLHRHDTMPDGVLDRVRLEALFGGGAPLAVAAMPFLAW
jgi:HAD superfamily hydrolase (TIGR01459 family)